MYKVQLQTQTYLTYNKNNNKILQTIEKYTRVFKYLNAKEKYKTK